MKRYLHELLNIVFRIDNIKEGTVDRNGEIREWTITTLSLLAISYILHIALKGDANDYYQNLGFLAIFIIFIKAFVNTIRDNRIIFEQKIHTSQNNFNTKASELKKEITDYLSNSRIVFESSIKDYDIDHLEALNQILQSLKTKSVKDIICLDNSDPHQWWSDSMTGYMALLSNWKSEHSFMEVKNINGSKESMVRMPYRDVSRIFVLTREELHSPVTLKTLSYHSMLGFRTYVFLKDMYDKIFDEYINADKENRENILKKKEFFIWNDSDKNTAKCNVNHFWNNICCFLSFWDLDMEKNTRDKAIKEGKKYSKWKSYYGGKPEHEINVYFEFIPTTSLSKQSNKKWKSLPEIYYEFGQELIKNTTCIDSFITANRKFENNFFPGIEIKSRSCSACSKFKKCNAEFAENGSDFVIVSNNNILEIVNAYINNVDYEIQKTKVD